MKKIIKLFSVFMLLGILFGEVPFGSNSFDVNASLEEHVNVIKNAENVKTGYSIEESIEAKTSTVEGRGTSTVVANPSENLSPGDDVTFTVTLGPLETDSSNISVFIDTVSEELTYNGVNVTKNGTPVKYLENTESILEFTRHSIGFGPGDGTIVTNSGDVFEYVFSFTVTNNVSGGSLLDVYTTAFADDTEVLRELTNTSVATVNSSAVVAVSDVFDTPFTKEAIFPADGSSIVPIGGNIDYRITVGPLLTTANTVKISDFTEREFLYIDPTNIKVYVNDILVDGSGDFSSTITQRLDNHKNIEDYYQTFITNITGSFTAGDVIRVEYSSTVKEAAFGNVSSIYNFAELEIDGIYGGMVSNAVDIETTNFTPIKKEAIIPADGSSIVPIGGNINYRITVGPLLKSANKVKIIDFTENEFLNIDPANIKVYVNDALVDGSSTYSSTVTQEFNNHKNYEKYYLTFITDITGSFAAGDVIRVEYSSTVKEAAYGVVSGITNSAELEIDDMYGGMASSYVNIETPPEEPLMVSQTPLLRAKSLAASNVTDPTRIAVAGEQIGYSLKVTVITEEASSVKFESEFESDYLSYASVESIRVNGIDVVDEFFIDSRDQAFKEQATHYNGMYIIPGDGKVEVVGAFQKGDVIEVVFLANVAQNVPIGTTITNTAHFRSEGYLSSGSAASQSNVIVVDPNNTGTNKLPKTGSSENLMFVIFGALFILSIVAVKQRIISNGRK